MYTLLDGWDGNVSGLATSLIKVQNLILYHICLVDIFGHNITFVVCNAMQSSHTRINYIMSIN